MKALYYFCLNSTSLVSCKNILHYTCHCFNTDLYNTFHQRFCLSKYNIEVIILFRCLIGYYPKLLLCVTLRVCAKPCSSNYVKWNSIELVFSSTFYCIVRMREEALLLLTWKYVILSNKQMLGNKFSNVWHLREGVSYKM